MRSAFAFIGSVLFLSSISSFAVPPPSWNIDRFLDDLRSGRVRTIEEGLLSLPESVRSSFTLLYEGHGLRGTSRDRPGVILFSNDGEFAITFGDPRHRLGNEFEIAKFDRRTARFTLFSAAFPENGAPARARVEKNPKQCLSCHRSDPMYLFGSYLHAEYSKPFWPGLYGSMDDVVKPPGTEHPSNWPPYLEYAPLVSFLDQMGKMERYRTLIRPVGAVVDPRRDDDSPLSPFTATEKDPRLELRPNDRLTEIVARQNGRRVARMLMQSRDFEEFPHWLLYRTIGCGKNDGGTRLPSEGELKPLRDRLADKISKLTGLSERARARLLADPLSVEAILAILGVRYADLQPNILDPVREGVYPFFYDGITYDNQNALGVNSVSYFAQDFVYRKVLKNHPNEILAKAYKPLTAIEQDGYFKDYPRSLAFDAKMDELAVSIDWKYAKPRGICDELLRLSLAPPLPPVSSESDREIGRPAPVRRPNARPWKPCRTLRECSARNGE